MKFIASALQNLWGLLVDDGAVASGGLLAVALVGALTRLTEPTVAWGLLLFALVWVGMWVSLRRAVHGALGQDDHGRLPEVVIEERTR